MFKLKKNCSQTSNATTCDDCIKEGCTYCESTKTCMKFDLVKDILHNKCPAQGWKFKQCLVEGKFILIAIPVVVFVMIIMVCVIICSCCGCKSFCRCCRGCGRCMGNICFYSCCCCCCCERDSSGSPGESHSLLRGVRRPTTQGAARRIQSATAKAFGGIVPKGSFSSRAQSTADRRAYWNIY